MHTQRRYATCPQGMSKKREKTKDAYPKKVCHTPTRCVKKKKENIAHVHENTRREIDHAKDFIHYPQKKYIYSTHLHLLIRLYDSFLLGFCF